MDRLYSALTPDCFRLLELLDDTGLSCNLASFKLQEAPPFVALSYTWGKASYQEGRPPDQEYEITINRQKVPVQQNLYDAITVVARDVREHGDQSHWFWVDFLCINQSDLAERSTQVGLMKTIYETSAAVFAWLGLPFDDEQTDLAVRLMRSFNKHLQTGLANHDNDIDAVLANIDSSTIGFPSVEDSSEWKAWMGIAEMMNATYWSRTWIYQEASTPGEIWFFCGTHCFNDIHLSATSAFASVFSATCPGFDPHFAAETDSGSQMSRLAWARLRRERGGESSLIDLVEEVRLTDCADHRDKIYAPLGHVTDVKPGQIPIDYTRDLRELFGDVVRFEISNGVGDRLRVLEHVHVPASDAANELLREVIDPSWPSWIPDWRRRVSIVPFYPQEEPGVPLADPSPRSKIKIEFSGTVMSIEGFTVNCGDITYVTSICEDDRDTIGATRTWHAEMTANDASMQTDESVRRSLVADAGEVALDATGQRRRTRGCVVDWDTIVAGDELSGRLSIVCVGRRMARTADGFIGMFPAAAQIGDIIAEFHGGHLLYLLRAVLGVEGHFNFIGPCYVDGLMDGEALRHSNGTRMLHLV